MALSRVIQMSLLGLAARAWGGDGDQARLMKEFKGAALVDVSRDERLILTRSRKRIQCDDGKRNCLTDFLTVYDNSTGKPIGVLVSPNLPSFFLPNRYLVPEFSPQGEVRVIELSGKSGNTVRLTWNPLTGSQRSDLFPFPKGFSYRCPIEDGRLLGTGERSKLLQVLEQGSLSPETIAVLADPPFEYQGKFNCRGWRSGPDFLLQDEKPDRSPREDHFGKRLTWFSTTPGVPARPCRTFENQRIHGYTISPDASRVAVITSPLIKLGNRSYLTILDRADCRELNRFELDFPERAGLKAPLLFPSRTSPDNVPFREQFARLIAVSPDNTKLSVAYGISKGRSGVAFFGVYSMTDGRRLATLKGDTYTPIFCDAYQWDIYSAPDAPIYGALQFSLDSKSLYTSSEKIRQWDLSNLR